MVDANKYPIVEVVWNDAWSSPGWINPQDMIPELIDMPRGKPCHTTGYLLERNRNRVVLVGSITEDQFGELFVIPRGMVETVTVLRPKGNRK